MEEAERREGWKRPREVWAGVWERQTWKVVRLSKRPQQGVQQMKQRRGRH